MSTEIFKVIKPGLQTTVQDLGRYGYQQFGISPSGAMDPYSLQMANILVGNGPGEAGLEISFVGPVLEAQANMVIAICGGDFSPQVDGEEVPQWKSFLLKKGQVLSVGACKVGARTFIAVAGGLDVPIILGSKSTFLNGGFGGYEGRALQKGDILRGTPVLRKPFRALHPKLIPEYKKELQLRVIVGPHQHMFTEASIERFHNGEYAISPQSNRMGYQLKGPILEHLAGPDIVSDPVPLGGIQVPASGEPIILMAERQTTGGYTRIGTVISVDIPKLAQAVPDTITQFTTVSIEEAHQLYKERQILIKHLSSLSRTK
ncbi:biotin-dependent carboxyltransferase family protein [Bacillus sp. FJAT-29814]|uniref:5-oxoprolinase subunit C family protein n=1 Tax=Bacillus sp. FJAT-29814 TaxID=1729688 RepID=UPI00083609D8|nr:biotin-dependent carboxyltransferase family protein [Bacillus sp. FJAT-29814]